jgi:hypothetical protein
MGRDPGRSGRAKHSEIGSAASRAPFAIMSSISAATK